MARRYLPAVSATTLAAVALLACATTVPAQAAPAAVPSSPALTAGDAVGTVRAALPAGTSRLVVRGTSASAPAAQAAARAARAAGASVVAVQATLGTVVVDVDPAAADRVAGRLAADPAVAAVSPSYAMAPMSLGEDSAGQRGSMALVADTIGARDLWRRGITGDGVGVALLDTGVAPVPGLLGADKVVVGPDLSFESQNPQLRHLDTYGHGTHMAGIIAGREGPQAPGSQYAADTTRFLGVAPDATVVSIKLADRYGGVDVSQVIAAIDYTVQHRDDLGVRIRVINLSYGTPSQQAPWADPLAYAAEVATRYGILVVAAAGNNGDNGYGLNNPAYHRNVLAVGSTSTEGTPSPDDDRVPWFSARQGGAAWWRGPDVVAPGAGVVSLRVPGSYIADAYPKAAVGARGIRGSGTSQSTAVVSGAAALLLQQRPWLTPAQLRWLLTRTAVPVPGAGSGAAGAGTVRVDEAARTWWVLSARTSTGTGRGSLERARGGVHVTDGDVELTGERDILGNPWGPHTADATAAAQMWQPGGTWNGGAWIGDGFVADRGPAGTWSGRTWSGRTWTGRTWTGRTWTGRTWTDARWTASGWVASQWPEPSDDVEELASRVWSTAVWPAR